MIVGYQSVFSSAKFSTDLAMVSSRVHMLSFYMVVEIGWLGDQAAVSALPLSSSQANHFRPNFSLKVIWQKLIHLGLFWKNRVFSFSSVSSAHVSSKSIPWCQCLWAIWAIVWNVWILEMLWLNVTKHLMPAWPTKLADHAEEPASLGGIFQYFRSDLFVPQSKQV